MGMYRIGMLCEVTSAKHAVLYEVTSAKHAVLYEVTRFVAHSYKPSLICAPFRSMNYVPLVFHF
jgi:hypothetical protein